MTTPARIVTASALALTLLAASAAAQAPWTEGFEGYAAGSNLQGQGGWDEWDGAVGTTSLVSTTRVRSGTKSAGMMAPSDAIHPFSGYTSGDWVMTVHQYVPGPGDPDMPNGNVHVLILSQYQHLGPYVWNVWYELDPTAGMLTFYNGGFGTVLVPAVFDKWVEYRIEIDISGDMVTCYYDGAQVGQPFTWSGGWNGTSAGIANIGTIDLFCENAAGHVYYDDLSLDKGLAKPVAYCTAKVNSLGCSPAISGTGTPSASNTGPFTVNVANMRNNKTGLYFYKVGGARANLAFQCGTLCVGPSGIKRTPASSAGGNPPPANDCSGVQTLDFNAFGAGLAGGNPDPALQTAGGTVRAQTWARDQGFAAPCNTSLSDALEWVLGT